MRIERVHPNFVSIVSGANFDLMMSGENLKALQQELLDTKVLIISRLEISPQKFISLCQIFGKIWRTDNEMKLEAHYQFEDFPELVKVSNHHGVLGPMELEYHSDGSHHPTKPYPLRALYGWKIPENCAGATTWIDMEEAYQKLPDNLKDKISNLKARHVPRYNTGWEHEVVYHPLTRVHPLTGRKSLSVDAYFTRSLLGLNEKEGADFLKELLDLAKLNAPAYKHVWSKHDVVIFDNNNTLHKRERILGEEERLLLRATLDMKF